MRLVLSYCLLCCAAFRRRRITCMAGALKGRLLLCLVAVCVLSSAEWKSHNCNPTYYFPAVEAKQVAQQEAERPKFIVSDRGWGWGPGRVVLGWERM